MEAKDLLPIFEEAQKDPFVFIDKFIVDPDNGGMFVPNYVQRQIIENLDQKYQWICVHRRAGKPQPLSSKILTPKGWVLMGDIKIGEKILTPAGAVATVTKLHPQGNQEIFRVEFNDGSFAESTEDHLWQFKESFKNHKATNAPLSTWKDRLLRHQNHRTNKFYLPPVCISGGKDIDNTYSLGIQLFTQETGINASTPFGVLVDYILDKTPTKRVSAGLLQKKISEKRYQKLRDLARTIPYSSRISRLGFINAFFDLFGEVGESSVDLTASYQDQELLQVVADSLRSLGCWVSITEGNIIARIAPGVSPFRSRARNTKLKVLDGAHLRRYVKDIYMVRNEEAQCITVDHPDHLYITDDYIPTHNCVDGSSIVVDADSNKRLRISEAGGVKTTLVFDFTLNKLVVAPCSWIKHEEQKEFVEIDLCLARNLKVSTDHILYERTHGEIMAGSLKVGDEILAPAIVEHYGTKDLDFEPSLTLPDLERGFMLNKPSLERFLQKVLSPITRHLLHKQVSLILTGSQVISEVFADLLLLVGIVPYLNGDLNLVVSDRHEQILLLRLLGADVESFEVPSPRRWVKVTSIHQIGPRDCYDLIVDHPSHNFLCNNMVVHNSIILSILALWHAVCFPGKQIWVYATSQDQIDEIFKNIRGFLYADYDPECPETALPSMLKAFKKRDSNSPSLIELTNRSSINGRTLGVDANSGSRDQKRGATADVVIVDEAQSLPDEAWRVITPMMSGGIYRASTVRNLIAGTIIDQSSLFFKRVFKVIPLAPKHFITKIAADENPDVTPDLLEEFKNDCPNQSVFYTEYLLRPASQETSVFRHDDIEKVFSGDYEYGPTLIRKDLVRFMGVDWDKEQAGTNICVLQWDPTSDRAQVIYREETDKQLGYLPAVSRIVQLYKEYTPDLVFADQGQGEVQWELLMEASFKEGLTLHEKLSKVHGGSKMVVPVFEGVVDTLDPKFLLEGADGRKYAKKYIKDFMVGLGQRAFEARTVRFPSSDAKAADQFYSYQIKEFTSSTRKFTSKNEHIIDAFHYCMLAKWTFVENGGFRPADEEVLVISPDEHYNGEDNPFGDDFLYRRVY